MPSSNMQYYVRTEDGHEYGPAEQDVLVQWAKSGRITSTCTIRNSMVKKWQPSMKVTFLEGLIHEEEDPKGGKGKDKKTFATMQNQNAKFSLNRPGRFKFHSASVGLRFGAWLMDVVVIGLVVVVMFLGATSAVEAGLDSTLCFGAFTAASLAVYFGYYALLMGLSAQTLGQWFWGIMVVRPNGEPVLVGRAFVFAFMELFMGWSTLVFVYVLPSKVALQDLTSGVRLSRITIREIAAASI